MEAHLEELEAENERLRAVEAAHKANVKMHGETQAYYQKLHEAEAEIERLRAALGEIKSLLGPGPIVDIRRIASLLQAELRNAQTPILIDGKVVPREQIGAEVERLRAELKAYSDRRCVFCQSPGQHSYRQRVSWCNSPCCHDKQYATFWECDFHQGFHERSFP